MKTSRIILSLFCLLTILACSKDDTNPVNELHDDITGTWIASSYTYTGYITRVNQDVVTETQFEGIGWEMHFNVMFSDSPKDYSSVGHYNVDHYYTNPDGIQRLYWIHFEVDDFGTWNRDNHTISLNINGDNKQGYITELTDSSLKLVISSSSNAVDENNVSESIVRTDYYGFTRSQ